MDDEIGFSLRDLEKMADDLRRGVGSQGKADVGDLAAAIISAAIAICQRLDGLRSAIQASRSGPE